MTKKAYIVESPLRHDGKDYAPGKKVDLEDDDAKQLIADKVVKDPAAKTEEKK
jgi:hypothetical protein